MSAGRPHTIPSKRFHTRQLPMPAIGLHQVVADGGAAIFLQIFAQQPQRDARISRTRSASAAAHWGKMLSVSSAESRSPSLFQVTIAPVHEMWTCEYNSPCSSASQPHRRKERATIVDQLLHREARIDIHHRLAPTMGRYVHRNDLHSRVPSLACNTGTNRIRIRSAAPNTQRLHRFPFHSSLRTQSLRTK